jgi:hypothetical protein
MIYKTELNGMDVSLDLDCTYFGQEPDLSVGFSGEEGIEVFIRAIRSTGGPIGSLEELEELINTDDEYNQIWEQWQKERSEY